MFRIQKSILLGVSLLATGTLAQTAMPTVNCLDVAAGRSKVVYVSGSTAIRPFLGVVANLVKDDGYTVVYQAQGSCTGVAALLDADPSKHLMKDIPAANGKAANYAIFFKEDGSAQECFLDPAGNAVDVGASDVYAESCGYELRAGFGDYQGPVQPMTFVVSSVSSQRSISAEAGYMAFGMGGNAGKAAPWVDPTYFFVRNASSGTQQMIARAIKVPADKWWGSDRGGSSAVRSGMKALLDPVGAEKGIGILSTDVTDGDRANLRVLAFRPFGGLCGYLPDSTPTSFDKRNVRDGHYPIWGPIHFFAATTGGVPNAAATALVTRFAAPRLEQSLFEAIIDKHLVPKCAMAVKRASEMGPFSSRVDTDFRCDCAFEKRATGVTTCTPCTTTTDCPSATPACNYGYCEAN